MQASNLVGQILGNYRLVSSLGKGGYAEVYLAEHANLPLKEKYAIKILKTQDLEGYQREEFRVEANLMATLVHRRIAKVQDYGFHKNMPYLVMEYAPGGTLRKVHPHGTQVPFPQIALYVKQMAEALQFAHDQKPSIVHRDVKPENMLVRGPNDVILSDFGIAIPGLNTGNLQQQQEDLLRKMARNENVMVPGTAAYIAPERLFGKTQRASDQYSLAVVVYEWLCGRRPFTGSDADICNKHVSTPPPPLVGVYPRVTPEIELVVMKGLAKEPEKRYRTVTEFANALEAAIQPSTYQVQSPPVQHIPSVPSLTAIPPMPGAMSSSSQQQNSFTFNVPAAAPSVPLPSFGNEPSVPAASPTMASFPNQQVMGQAPVPPSPFPSQTPTPTRRAQPQAAMPTPPMPPPSPQPQVFTPPRQVNTPPQGIQQPINQAPGLIVPDFNSLSSPQMPVWGVASASLPQQPLPVNAAFPPPVSTPADAVHSAMMPPPNQPQGQPFVAAAPPPPQPQPWWNQGAAPYAAFPHGDETVSSLTQRSTWSEIKTEVNDFLSKPMDSAARFVETDVFFTRLPRYRWAFPLGVATNLLGMFIYLFSAASSLGWIPSIILAVLGFTISLFCFRQCLITVKKITAIGYGVIVAAWWWIVIATLASLLRVPSVSAIVAGAIAFAFSIGIHVWHVDARRRM